MKRNIVMLFMLATSLFSGFAAGEPITIFGINWSMEPMIDAVENKGYVCKEEETIFGGKIILCSLDEKEILVGDDVVTFSCGVFNGCGYSIEEVAQNLVDENIVNTLEHEVQTLHDGTHEYKFEKFCTRGKEGDKLCVAQDMTFTGETIIKIELMKDQYGKGGMSFK